MKVSAWAYIHCVINRKNGENGRTFEELKQKNATKNILLCHYLYLLIELKCKILIVSAWAYF